MRSSPNRIPNSSRSSRYASACRRFISLRELFQLRSEPLQLLALGLNDVRRRLLHEALVRELALSTCDLLLEHLAALGLAPRRPLRVDGVRRQDVHGPAGDRHG